MIAAIGLFLTTTLGRVVAGAGIALVLVLGAYVKGNVNGRHSERAKWERAIIVEQQRQAKVIAGAQVKKLAADAKVQAELAALQKQVDDYEKELESRPAAARCTLSDRDAKRLQDIR